MGNVAKKHKDRSVSLIVFYDEKGRILLQDRTSISKAGEEWGFFGGGIEEGETPREAVIRETKEELSIDLDDFEFLGEHRHVYPEGNSLTSYVFISPLKDNMRKFKLMEGDGMRMFEIKGAKEMNLGKSAYGPLAMINKYISKKK